MATVSLLDWLHQFVLLLNSIGILSEERSVFYSTIKVCVQRITAVYIDVKETKYKNFNVVFYAC